MWYVPIGDVQPSRYLAHFMPQSEITNQNVPVKVQGLWISGLDSYSTRGGPLGAGVKQVEGGFVSLRSWAPNPPQGMALMTPKSTENVPVRKSRVLFRVTKLYG